MMDLSVIVAVDGDGRIIEKNIFYRKDLISDPRVVVEVSGSAGIFMESMIEEASVYVGMVCPKIAALKNERTFRIFCETAATDEDSWPCTVFANERTLPIVLDTCECHRLVVVAPHKRNADFSYRRWKLSETEAALSDGSTAVGHDVMIYEPCDDLEITESEMSAEIDRICDEMDSAMDDPATEDDMKAIGKVLDFIKDGLLVDNSHMEAFDNDYENDIDPDELMRLMIRYVNGSLAGYVPMSLFQRALAVQNGALKRLGANEELARRNEQTIESFRAHIADTVNICGEGVRQELETVNLKYNSVNERLDGMQMQIGNIVSDDMSRSRVPYVIQFVLAIMALAAGIVGIIF